MPFVSPPPPCIGRPCMQRWRIWEAMAIAHAMIKHMQAPIATMENKRIFAPGVGGHGVIAWEDGLVWTTDVLADSDVHTFGSGPKCITIGQHHNTVWQHYGTWVRVVADYTLVTASSILTHNLHKISTLSKSNKTDQNKLQNLYTRTKQYFTHMEWFCLPDSLH